MPLTPGTRLGVYEVTAPIGEGGMGQVYRATDTTLGRQVAIKILPDAFASDPERLARFEREAKTLASLNHSHIAAIYAVEKSAGLHALVMELVEGEDLAQRIARGAIPLDEALPIAKQIAEALEAAHEQGIIHRDLKPANIKVRPDGTVKVLDFGLAKAMELAPRSSPSVSQSPTITTPAMTQAGMILGTAAYMAPEQARGKPVDKRADIWAFGCVLYEMLTGRPVFTGDTITDVLGAIVKSDPDWTALPRETPPPIRRLLRRCLAKDPTERLHAIADARLEIAEARAESDAVVIPGGASSPRRERLARILAGAAVAVLGLAVSAVLYFRTTAPVQVDAPEVRLQVITPPTTDPISLSLSPDGHRLVFVALGDDGSVRLWLRALDVVAAQPLGGTEGAIYPFWSPDSRSIGFFAQGKLKRIDIGSGQPQVLADAPGVRGGTWNRDGVILFSPSATQGLFRVPASGGDAMPVTQLAPRQTSHRFPQFLPDGRQFLYFVQGSQEVQGVYLGALDSPVTSLLTTADVAAMYASPGYVLYIRQGALVARRFDTAAGTLSGDPVTVADPTAFDGGVNAGAFSASAAGAIAHRAGGSGRRQLTWFDREGRTLGTVGPPDENSQNYPELSPDGHRVVVDRTLQDNRDLWLIDVIRGVPMKFTFDPNVDSYPIWSPDGSRIVFRSNRGGTFDLYQKPTGNRAAETVLLASDQTKFFNDWSPDGRFLLYASVNPRASNDIWVAPLQGMSNDPRGDLTPFPFVNTAYDENAGQFSPDGRWVAYQSNESGPMEVYVQPFPGPGGRSRISTAGGSWPRWRPDGRELFYVAPDGKLMGVPTLASGSTLQPGTPVALFQTRMSGFSGGQFRAQYDVAADGRFLINHSLEDAASPITVILNWAAGLNKLR